MIIGEKILCFSMQVGFQEKLPKRFENDLKRCLNANEVVFRQFTVDGSGQHYKTDIDWEGVKKEGFTIVVLCDDPNEFFLDTFFYEAAAKADLKRTFWYSRYTGKPNFIEMKRVPVVS